MSFIVLHNVFLSGIIEAGLSTNWPWSVDWERSKNGLLDKGLEKRTVVRARRKLGHILHNSSYLHMWKAGAIVNKTMSCRWRMMTSRRRCCRESASNVRIMNRRYGFQVRSLTLDLRIGPLLGANTEFVAALEKMTSIWWTLWQLLSAESLSINPTAIKYWPSASLWTLYQNFQSVLIAVIPLYIMD